MLIVLRALRGILDSIWLLLQPAMRFIGWVFAVMAFVAFIADWTDTSEQTAGLFGGISLADHMQSMAPGSFTNLMAAVERNLHPWVWDPMLSWFLYIPMWMSLALLSALLLYFSRYRERINVFVN